MIVHPDFNPIAVSFGVVQVHWYGLMYLFGFALGGWLGVVRAKGANDWRASEMLDLTYYIALGVILGGRLGYVLLYNPAAYLANPLDALAIWDGGMSFHGGLLGVVAAIFWYARKTRRGFFAVSDFLAPLVAPGLGFGRLGNFINQELWGRVTDVPWAVWFPRAPPGARHPSQLYEFAGEGVLLFVIVWLYSSRPRVAGRVSGVFLLGYGVARFIAELFREPDAHLGAIALGLSMGQWLSLPMIVFGAFLWRRRANVAMDG